MTGEFETDVTVHRRNLVRKGKRKQCIGLSLAECWQTLYVRALVETIFAHAVLVNIRIHVIPLDRGICDVGGPELRVLDTFGCRSRLGPSCLLSRLFVGYFVLVRGEVHLFGNLTTNDRRMCIEMQCSVGESFWDLFFCASLITRPRSCF